MFHKITQNIMVYTRWRMNLVWAIVIAVLERDSGAKGDSRNRKISHFLCFIFLCIILSPRGTWDSTIRWRLNRLRTKWWQYQCIVIGAKRFLATLSRSPRYRGRSNGSVELVCISRVWIYAYPFWSEMRARLRGWFKRSQLRWQFEWSQLSLVIQKCGRSPRLSSQRAILIPFDRQEPFNSVARDYRIKRAACEL